MSTYVYYDAVAKKVQIATEEVSDAGEYIGELAEPLDPRSPYAKFVVSAQLRHAGYNVSGITITAYKPSSENQET